MNVPIPSRKPDLTGGGSILDDIWNGAKGVFEFVGGVEAERYISKRLEDIRGGEETATVQRQQTLAGGQSFVPSLLNSQGMPTTTTYVGLAMIAGAVFLIARN